MKAARIHRFGPPDAIVIDDLPRPTPVAGQVLIRVAAAGVGPWDALIREQKGIVKSPLPLTLGSDLSGIVETTGENVTKFKPGDKVYGVTNPEFIGAYTEYALASATMIAKMPETLGFNEAASVPVVAVTAWQMLFEYAKAEAGQSVLIHGAGGNVGAYAVQLASQAGLRVFATASSDNARYVQGLGASTIVDYKATAFDEVVPPVDIVLDTVGGDTRHRSFRIIKPGGILVSVVAESTAEEHQSSAIRAAFFLVEVTSERLDKITDLFDRRKLVTRVGTVLPLEQARVAHEMLGGAPHKNGKIILRVGDLA